jgi:hypothetical protein
VYNNPLMYTDPSGFAPFWKKKWFKTLAAVGISFWLGPQLSAYFDVAFGTPMSVLDGGVSLSTGQAAASAAATAGSTGFVASMVATGGDLKASLQQAGIGALSGGLFSFAGDVGAATRAGSFEHYAAHAGAGCLTAVAQGGKCGQGAVSAVGSKFATLNMPDMGTVGNGIGTVIVGGTTSVIGGGKFANGAESALYGYLFNCLASKCNSANYDPRDPNYHFSSVVENVVCNISTDNCLSHARTVLSCDSAPGQVGCTAIGEEKHFELTGGNWITQYRPNADIIINGTTKGKHILDDGFTIRWLATRSNGDVVLYTGGMGVNSNSALAYLNQHFGPNLFRTIGQDNRDKIQGCLRLRAKVCN